MFPVSDSIKTLFEKGCRKCVRITLNNAQVVDQIITDADIVSGSFSLDRYCATGNSLEIGSAVSSELSFVLDNHDGRFDGITFEGAELFAEVGITNPDNVSAGVHYIPCGYFTVDEPPRAYSKISLKALDFMMRFDKGIDWSLLSFPMSYKSLLIAIAGICDVELADFDVYGLPNINESVSDVPQSTEITVYRQLLQWIAQATGTCAFMDWEGKLRLSWFTESGVRITPAVRYSGDLLENDISVTRVDIKAGNETFSSDGTGDYPIVIDGNGIIASGREQTVANAVYGTIGGFTYRPFECSCMPMPYLFPLDIITYVDKNGNEIRTAVTNHTFSLNGVSMLAAQGETKQKKSYAAQKQVTKKEIEAAIQSAMKGFDASAEHIYVKYSPYEGGRDADGNIVWTDSVQDNTVFLGTCATNEKTAPDTPESYQWVRVRGIDGRGISKVENYYLTTDKSENVTLDDFSGIKPDVIVSPTKGKPYIWNYEKILYSDGSSDSSAPSLIGHYGVDGTGIEKIEELYAVSTSGTTAPITGWGTSVPSMTATNRFLWNKETIYFTDGTSQPTDPMVIGVYGEKGDKGDTGKGISSVKNYYLISSSSSGITTASTGWVETPIPTPTSAKPYLWNYEKIIYTNGDTLSTTPCVIGNFAKDGANGASINTITEYYALTATNTAPSINQFKTAVQTPTSALPYLWNYEVITYTGGKTATSTAIRLMGVYGQKGDTGDTGRGVASIKTQYYRSTSRTTQTGGTWSDSYPEWQAGTYLWTREVTTFTNPAGTSNGSPVLDTSWDALSDLKESISVTDEASKELNETLANALGLHVTEKTVNNATVRYYHSNPTLTSSTNGDTILVFNSSGFGVCTTGWNGGNPVFTYGTTFDGKAVWNILSANKISADLIEAGVIKSLSDAAVQSKWNLNDGTMEFTSGDDNLLIKGRTKDSGETAEETAKFDAVNPYRFLGIHMSNSAGEIVSVTPGFIGFLSDEYMAQLSLYVQALIKDALNGTNTADKYIPTNIYSSRITKDGIITKFIKCQDILFPGDGEEVRLMDVLERISALEDKVFVKYNLYVGVAYSSSGRGETTPSGINSYRSGESITIDAIPSPGYVFSCWGYSGDGTTNYTKQSNTNGKPLYTFTKNEKEDRYVAYFDYPSTYTIDTTVGSTLYIGNGSTEIASNAYYNNSDISTVIIPNSITAIGLNAFSGCSGITSVTLGSGITDIRGYAFMGCNNLKYIYLPASVTNIYYHAFDGCSSLNTVYFGGTEAQWNAIYNAGYNDSLFNAPNIIFNYSI